MRSVRKVFFIGALIAVLGLGYVSWKETVVPSVSETPWLSAKEEATLQEELKEIAFSQSPKEAIAVLRIKGEDDPRVLRVCHDLAHFIGHESMKRYGSFKEAIQYQDSLCNSGYLHGVMEEYLITEAVSSSTLLSMCDQTIPGSFAEWQCFHGLGHGFMFMKRHDLSQALFGCASLGEERQRAQCANGAYMEIFSIDGVKHRSPQLNPSNPMATCVSAKEDVLICAFYAPTQYLVQHPGDFIGALQYCEGVSLRFRSSCVSGVGMQAMKEHLDDPEFATRVCDATSLLMRASCRQGAATLLLFHFGDAMEAAQATCRKVSWQKACESEVAKNSSNFNDLAK